MWCVTANLYFKHPIAIVYKVKELTISHNKNFFFNFRPVSVNYKCKVFFCSLTLITSSHVFRMQLFYLKMAMLAETCCKTHLSNDKHFCCDLLFIFFTLLQLISGCSLLFLHCYSWSVAVVCFFYTVTADQWLQFAIFTLLQLISGCSLLFLHFYSWSVAVVCYFYTVTADQWL